MAISLDDYMAGLPAAERQKIEAGAARLIAEEATLRQLRKARRASQVKLAERLGIGQAAVSKLERRTDMYVSTLRELIRAMGGELEIIARFPDQPPMKIAQFRTADADAPRESEP